MDKRAPSKTSDSHRHPPIAFHLKTMENLIRRGCRSHVHHSNLGMDSRKKRYRNLSTTLDRLRRQPCYKRCKFNGKLAHDRHLPLSPMSRLLDKKHRTIREYTHHSMGSLSLGNSSQCTSRYASHTCLFRNTSRDMAQPFAHGSNSHPLTPASLHQQKNIVQYPLFMDVFTSGSVPLLAYRPSLHTRQKRARTSLRPRAICAQSLLVDMDKPRTPPPAKIP